jgi:type IX secretion system PorP/SprF family membrane protein
MIKKLLTISILLVLTTQVQAQFEASYSQYMFNGLAINPAYAGSQESLSMSIIYRFHSPAINGSATTQTLTAHSGIKGKKIGLGLMLITDKIGITRQTGVYASFAYKIKFNNATLSLGLQGGGTSVKSDFSQLLIKQPGDPLAAGDVQEFQPNIGAGVYYHSKIFYAGLSMPQMLDEVNSNITQFRPLILTTGVVFKLNPALKLKPNLLVRLVEGQLVEFNYNMNLLIHEILWLGVSYRPTSSVTGLLEIQITNQLRLGYAYDATISDLSKADSGSHEILLNYRLRFSKKKVVNPVYF